MSPRRRRAEPVQVVLHPGLIPLGFYEDSVRRLLLLWRNGYIRPQMSRPLVIAILDILAELGLEEDELNRWALWLCDSRRSDMHRLSSSTVGGAVDELSASGHRILGCDTDEVSAFVEEVEAAVV